MWANHFTIALVLLFKIEIFYLNKRHFIKKKKSASLVAQPLKNLPAMWETWVVTLSWEDPLEKGISTHSSILAWRIPWTKEPGGLQSMGLQRVRLD